MRIDFATLAFGYKVKAGGGTPNWATSLGQGKEYKINNDPSIDEILKGAVYSSVPLSKITTKIGKGGRMVSGDAPDSPIILAAVFPKVFINDVQITDGKFILLVTKDTSESHAGRLRIKYGPSNTYEVNGQKYSNADFLKQAREQLSLAEDACWFVSDISVANQNELILKTVIVDPSGPVEYANTAVQHTAWSDLEATVFHEEDAVVEIGENIILYGIPGCGKSHTIKEQYCDDEFYMERVVFHPDYTYSDFVGQILPQSIVDESGNKRISYPFIPGPFTRILRKATRDHRHNYYLVIEELNRGNAPAIFGELFQLLDRLEGVSEYGINNADIALEVYGDAEHAVKLPKNLYVLATMNTADQNVFTLDTAFKRRWKMKSIVNNIKKCGFANDNICGFDISWATFLETMNKIIIDLGDGNIGSEDKRLGAFFIKKAELDDVDLFSEKVLMYLWNDAFKYDHDKVFKAEYKTLEQLISGFKADGFKVFLDTIHFEKVVVDIEGAGNNNVKVADANA